MSTAGYLVEGMTCGYCMGKVHERVRSLSGVTKVAMDLGAGGLSPLLVMSGTKIGAAAVRDAVESVGFGLLLPSPDLPHDVVVSATNPVVEIGRDQEKEKTMNEQTSTVTDPVCGMTVDPATATSVEHEGATYYFCAKHCAKTFTANPGAYLKSDSAS